MVQRVSSVAGRLASAAVMGMALAAGGGAAGCGQKGPLTLPKPTATPASAPASAPVPAAS